MALIHCLHRAGKQDASGLLTEIVMRGWLIPIMLAATLSGCASTESVKASQQESVHRVYAAPYNAVYAATLAAAKAQKLELVESDPAAGRIVVSHGISLWSWGERIAIWLHRLNESNTDVAIATEIVRMKATRALTLAISVDFTEVNAIVMDGGEAKLAPTPMQNWVITISWMVTEVLK